ncbi:hypothetical protein [Chryseobacterium koreense]|uniref:Oxidase n=1 Tax=Chryseobacterium koreense CCUG 49689 TaxID=1304281 RepID=A0A0J7IWP8_9FLAO|nr:hypothetical protein [Chryseobacterium koreense]KMQ70246.1 hypothetical protein ACM44_13415 [Chryseobacterium koreense CCUG 49689]MBB5334747.1 hypothetical protein [Chryseobacterium koreense]
MKRKDFGIQLKPVSAELYDLDVQVMHDQNGKIISGLVLGPTLYQNLACLLMAEPGDFKLSPDLGVGLRNALLDEDLLRYRHAVKEQAAKDGIFIKHLNLYNLKNYSIEAEYE